MSVIDDKRCVLAKIRLERSRQATSQIKFIIYNFYEDVEDNETQDLLFRLLEDIERNIAYCEDVFVDYLRHTAKQRPNVITINKR